MTHPALMSGDDVIRLGDKFRAWYTTLTDPDARDLCKAIDGALTQHAVVQYQIARLVERR
jgi:hypothetical protein